jgi:arylformamidase
MLLIDLSHTITDKLITYKGLPAPLICDYLSREDSEAHYEDATFQIGKIEMVGNTGTYIDCPFHRYENGKDFTQMDLSAFAELEAIVIHVPYIEGLEVRPEHLKEKDIQNKAVLFHTGWDRFWASETYFENHPYINEQAAIYLRDQKVKLVGIDSMNVDDTRSRKRPTHSVLLANDILIVEHLCNLGSIPAGDFTFTATPPKIKGIGTFPVRAFAKCKV